MKQRQCVALIGESEWCFNASENLLANFDSAAILWVSDDNAIKSNCVKPKQVKSQLGKEFDAVVFDGLTELSADSLGIVVGTIRAGGVLILLLSSSQQGGLWAKRFNAILARYSVDNPLFHTIRQFEELPNLETLTSQTKDYQTVGQTDAITAIIHVVEGHRRRPLVISADRGRGKSAALGMAAAQLILKGKQRILVTAPSLSTTDTLFSHAAVLLPQATLSRGLIVLGKSRIEFMAPDAIIEAQPEVDLLLVDESAAIPVAMLTKLLVHYSRLVFATTLHGYEGTGRGFAIRFNNMLDLHAPGWKQHHMVQPIRWSDNDRVEEFSFDALLLNASAVADESLAKCLLTDCNIDKVDKVALIEDELALTELFGLMVMAHYRTRPSDLKMMLDRDDISVYAMRYQGHIVATAWLVDEGSLDEAMAEAIYKGTRRPAGHLLPQSLLAHTGLIDAGGLRYRRIMRIAVHPALQRKGLATSLISTIAKEAESDKIDALGISYSIDNDLLHFWQVTGFQVVRLGMHKSHVSEGRALMMLKALSTEGEQFVVKAKKHFSGQWPELLCRQFADLATEQVISLSQMLDTADINLSEQDWRDINSFANDLRGYEFCHLAIRRFVVTQLTKTQFLSLSDFNQRLLILLVIQEKPWNKTAGIVGKTGKNELVTSLRQAVVELISHGKGEL